MADYPTCPKLHSLVLSLWRLSARGQAC